MRVFFLTVIFSVCAFSSSAQMKWNAIYQSYIDQYKDLAIEQMLRYRIPASITLAQGIFESGAGRSELSLKGNNHFGIKCHGWTGASIYHDDDELGECFRAYQSVHDSYEDHSKFLSGSQRYQRLFRLSPTDYRGWAVGLKECGYATNPLYAQKLIELIELYRLYEFDTAKSDGKFVSKDASTGSSRVVVEPLHPIYRNNDNYYLRARRGDTFKSIGAEVEISYRALARYNERGVKEVLSEGDIIYLKKKRTRADKSFKNKVHVVSAGESMYDIAQMYGIRLKSLYKKNKLSPEHHVLSVGDNLRVY